MVQTLMQNEIILKAHQQEHFSVQRTVDVIQRKYDIPELHYIIANNKMDKQEAFLHPIIKIELPFHTYHVDYLGPLNSTAKRYNHILAVIDTLFVPYEDDDPQGNYFQAKNRNYIF